jgi:ribose transport system substrate-binding protein
MRIRTAPLVAAAAAATMSLAACGSASSGSAGSAGSAGSSSGGGTKPVTVTFVEGVAGDPFYETMACGAKAEAAKDGVQLSVQGAKNWDASLQVPLLNSVVATKPDALFIAPNDSKALIPPLKQASDAGIKVVLVDTTLTDTSFVVSSIASDNAKGGEAAAEALAQLVGQKGSVLLVGGQPGVSTAEARQQGFETGLKKYPNLKYLGNVFTSNGVAKISQLVSAQLAAHPDLVGIFALSTDQSEGANNAVKAAGKAGAVKLVGFDAGPTQVEQLRAGIVQALIAQQPAQIGADGVQQAAAAVRGGTVQKQIGTDSATITAQNVDQPDIAKYLYRTTCS